jgi:hypothetical protein
MDVFQIMDQLKNEFQHKDWFHSVGLDQYGRPVIYVHVMNHETLYDIPDSVDGKQVLTHYAASKLVTIEQFTNKSVTQYVPTYSREIDVSAVVLSDEPTVDDIVGPAEEEKSLRHLQNELDRLEKACGSYTLQDIFYEVHDGPNAVTSMSARHPDVRKSLEKLYKMYGFNVIYEELDG